MEQLPKEIDPTKQAKDRPIWPDLDFPPKTKPKPVKLASFSSINGTFLGFNSFF